MTEETKVPALLKIASKRKFIPVELVGVVYQVKPPKAALAIVMAKSLQGARGKDPEKILKTLYDWLSMAMSHGDIEAVKARINDPEDDLDLTELMELMTALTEMVAENPTT